jgi:hypothetical protein
VNRTREVPGRPHWRDLIQFFEYFHGDTGAGLGANRKPDGPVSSAVSALFATTTAEQASSSARARRSARRSRSPKRIRRTPPQWAGG